MATCKARTYLIYMRRILIEKLQKGTRIKSWRQVTLTLRGSLAGIEMLDLRFNFFRDQTLY